MAERYRFLKISTRIFNVLAWLALAAGLAIGVMTFVNNPAPLTPRVTATVMAVVFGALYFIIFGTASGVIRLLLDIESKLK